MLEVDRPRATVGEWARTYTNWTIGLSGSGLFFPDKYFLIR